MFPGKRLGCSVLFILTLTVAGAARADLLIGDYRGSGTPGPVLRFAETADGNVAPSGSFYTNLNGGTDVLQAAWYMTYEPVENVVYVADFFGQTIRVYAAGASGNVAAVRVLNPPLLGQPRRVAISTEHDELITTASGCCIATYPRTASGSAVAALRMVQWGGLSGSVTRLNYPQGVVLRKSSDEIIVVDSERNPDSSYSGVVLFFARMASGNTAPTRVLKGTQTLLGSGAFGVAYDSIHDEIIVLSSDSTTLRISTFAGTASGDTAPLRSIAGNLTLLEIAAGVVYDSASATIYVWQGGYNGYLPRVLAFARTANGDVAPMRVIAGVATTLVQPSGLEVAPFALIFKNGFE